MAVATLPVLGVYTLPAPQTQGYARIYRGGTLTMASGKIIHDLVDTTPRHRFRLRFVYLSASQLNTLILAYDAIKNTTATYEDITSSNYVVTRPEGGELEIEPVITAPLTAGAQGEIKYNVTMELIEDS